MTVEPVALVTRPSGQADNLMSALRAAGFAPWHLPMLSIQPIDPLPAEDSQRLLDLDRYDHLLFVSSNAAKIGLALIQDYWPQFPVGQTYWAVGEGTARAIEKEGLKVERPQSDMNSEGLLAMPGLAELVGQRVLIVKGEGGRSFLEEQLRGRGAEVNSLHCYRRTPAQPDAEGCRHLISERDPSLILVSSGEGLEQLSRLLQPREHTNLAKITLLVPSPRVVEQARQLGWERIERTENASDSAMLAAARVWREAHQWETQH